MGSEVDDWVTTPITAEVVRGAIDLEATEHDPRGQPGRLGAVTA